MGKSQAECRNEYIKALADFLSECNDIDQETPWSSVEPAWWLSMKDMERRAMQAAKDAQKPEGKA